MNRSFLPLLLLLGTVLAVAVPRQAQAQAQTGSLVLEAVDAEGNAIADVAITLEGASLQGIQVRETDERGRARFAFLPPGSYEAEFEAEGYVTFRRSFAVGLGSALVEEVQMTSGEMVETQVVSGQAPLDVTDTGINYSFGEEKLQNLQIGSANRDYLGVLGRAGGTAGGGNPNVHGATIGENRYLVDGVDTTDPVTGTFGQNLNFDSIEAVEFQTGGFRAESGQATGGIVNVVTKSGSNEFTAIVDMRYNDNGLQDSTAHLIDEDNPDLATEDRDGDGINDSRKAFDNASPAKFRRLDVTLGGPIKKDKLWYQFAYSDIDNSTQPSGGDGNRAFSGEDLLAKLTWQANDKHRVAVQYTADPADIVGANAGYGVRNDAHRTQEQGADFFSVNYWGQFPHDWNLNMRAGFYESQLDSTPTVDGGEPARINLLNNFLSRNYNDAQFSTRVRNQFAFDLEHQTKNDRWHAIKFGMELQDNSFTSRRGQPGGAVEYVLGGDDVWGTNGPVVRRDTLVPVGELANDGLVKSFYAQSTWHATDAITVDFGLRYDHTSMNDDTGEKVVSMGKLQPRLGLSWDVLGDKRHALSWHVGRYMDPLILTVANAVNKNSDLSRIAINEAVYGIDCNGDGNFDDMLFDDCFIFGGGGSRVDERLAPTYVDEVTVGYKFQIRSNLRFGARWVWRQTEDIIEDREIATSPGLYEVVNLPGLTRKYQGVELDVSWEGKRVHLFGNWTISGSKGNVEYTQHLGSDFDIFPVHYDNRYGYLSDDRRHRVKLFGWVDLPKQFTLSWDAFFGSGSPYSVTTATAPYGVTYLEERGSRRRPSIMNIDVELKKEWDVGDKANIQLIGSIFNLTKENAITGISGNEASLGDITAYQRPRRYEFGFRFRWN